MNEQVTPIITGPRNGEQATDVLPLHHNPSPLPLPLPLRPTLGPVKHDRQDSNPRDSSFGDRPRPQSLRSSVPVEANRP